MVCQMALLPLTLKDLRSHFCYLKSFQLLYLGKSQICLLMNWKANVACNSSCLNETEWLLEVTHRQSHTL